MGGNAKMTRFSFRRLRHSKNSKLPSASMCMLAASMRARTVIRSVSSACHLRFLLLTDPVLKTILRDRTNR
eukprot:5645444-Amphidinium_carterae.1